MVEKPVKKSDTALFELIEQKIKELYLKEARDGIKNCKKLSL
ncbi:Uncharacterised protein [Legionella spiritensis]|nr:Uncharacterised protein [Legionella spiritensis]